MTSERLTLALVIAAAVAPACAESRRLDWAFCPLWSFRISTQFLSCFSSTDIRSNFGRMNFGGGVAARGAGAAAADAGDRIRQRRGRRGGPGGSPPRGPAREELTG